MAISMAGAKKKSTKKSGQIDWHKPVHHHHAIVAIGAALLIAMVALNAGFSSAASTAFVIRGDVMQIDRANKNIKVYIRQTDSAAEQYLGSTREINVGQAVFYKYDAKQNKVRTTFGGAMDNTGYEVAVKGKFDASDVFKATEVTRNDNLVKLRGYVRGQSTANNTLDIEIDSMVYQATGKTYRPNTFKTGGRVLVYYGESTKFYSREGNAMNEDEILNKDEKITIEKAQVRFGSRVETDVNSTIRDGRWLF